MTVVSAALRDSAREVRDAAVRAFYELGDEPLSAFEPLLLAFANSPALSDDSGVVLHALEESRHPLPPSTLDLCEAFVREHVDKIGDISTGAAGDATYVVRLALRLHAQNADPVVRRRCLDLIDNLVVLGAHGIEGDLDSIER